MSDQNSIILLSRSRTGESWSSVAGSLPAHQSTSDDSVQRIDASARNEALPALTTGAELSDVFGVEGTVADQSHAERFMSLLPETASTPLKPWLIKAFDRDYFKQVCHVYYTSRSQFLPLGPGSQASFGNMSFSSAIYANYHPELVQETQQHNFRVPIWAPACIACDDDASEPVSRYHDRAPEPHCRRHGGRRRLWASRLLRRFRRRRHLPSSTHTVPNRRTHCHKSQTVGVEEDYLHAARGTVSILDPLEMVAQPY